MEHMTDTYTAADLSRLLWGARETAEMFADIVEARTGKRDESSRRLVEEIDAYRAHRGWSPHGFGHENDLTPNVIRLEFEFYPDTRDADLTRLSQAHDALEAQGVIVRSTQLGHREPYPDE